MSQFFKEVWKHFRLGFFFLKVKLESGVSGQWDDNQVGVGALFYLEDL